MMDMTKAFDMVQYSVLFFKLIAANLPAIIIRLLMLIYTNQIYNSDVFKVGNSVSQGAICSGIFYSFYVNQLFSTLREQGVGCWVEGEYQGIWGYSDDSYLLAPSEDALQEMLLTCENYAKEHNLKFSTDSNPNKCKTKCLAFLKKQISLKTLFLCGNPLPWVSGGLHLGHNLSTKYDGMKTDMKMKRGQFVAKSCELQQEFSFAHPDTKVQTYVIYNSHFTGSPLWDLFCKEFVMIENSWNVSVRHMYNLPLQTHRYLVEPLSQYKHIKTVLIRRFLSFIEQLRRCPKHLPGHLLNIVEGDVRSTKGSNLRNIMLLCGKSKVEELTKDDANFIKYHPIADDDKWRVSSVRELVDIRESQLHVEGFKNHEINDILNFICTS